MMLMMDPTLLGLAGVIAFVASFLLGHPIELSPAYFVLILIGMILVIAAMVYFILRTLKIEKSDHDSDLHHSTGKVIKIKHDHRSGQIEIRGEFWKFVSDENLNLGDSVKVISRQGLTLKVQKGEAAWNSSLS